MMTAMYICLNRGTTGGGLSLPEFVKLSADAGFAGADVDLGYALQHGASALRDLYESHHQRFGGWGPPDWRGDASKAQENLAQLKPLATLAAEMKIDSAATWLMPSSDLPFIENWNFHVQRLRPVAQILAERGLRLGLEYVAPYHLRRKFPHEFVFTTGQMLELADAIGPNVGLLIDCFHVHCAGDTMERVAQVPATKIVLAHLNDAPRIPVQQVQDNKRLLPGEGAIDVAGFLGALHKAGYDGPVSLEVFSEQLRAIPPLEAAKRAWSASKKVLDQANIQ
jgi:sugar phosphate isomerase/epimerase